jgi:hypothetical protein
METERILELLEDFDIVGNRMSIALIAMEPTWPTLRENIEAAIIAASARLASIDYARKKYVEPISDSLPESTDREYISAYKSAKEYMRKLRSRLCTREDDPPSKGVFGASLVLERLPMSFFSAHILYRLGLCYEGHSVSRQILEQIAWAYTACDHDDFARIEKIQTTKTIAKLKKIIPNCGTVYGYLSNKTHIDYTNHGEFLSEKDGRLLINLTQDQYYEYAQAILYLADWYGIVWEISQYKYLSEVENIHIRNNTIMVKPDRPFTAIAEKHLKKIKGLYNKDSLSKKDNSEKKR